MADSIQNVKVPISDINYTRKCINIIAKYLPLVGTKNEEPRMDISIYTKQAVNMGTKLINTIPFIVNNKLWRGFFEHRLVMIVAVLTAIVIPWSIFRYIESKSEILSSYSLSGDHISTANIQNSVSFQSLFEGGNKWLILILIQMLVVYFSNKTIEHLSGVTIQMSGKEMIQSQIRTIVVVIRNWIFELIIGIGISIVIGIFGPDFMVDWFKYFVGCYFVGYLFIDNYNHTFGVSIKDSAPIVRSHLGAALVIGLVAKILFLLPVVGAIFVSFICSVGATWYMHTSPDRHAGVEAFAD